MMIARPAAALLAAPVSCVSRRLLVSSRSVPFHFIPSLLRSYHIISQYNTAQMQHLADYSTRRLACGYRTPPSRPVPCRPKFLERSPCASGEQADAHRTAEQSRGDRAEKTQHMGSDVPSSARAVPQLRPTNSMASCHRSLTSKYDYLLTV